MTRALKVALTVYGVIHILLGLAFILVPNQAVALMGFGEIDAAAIYVAALCGIMFIAASVWLIVIGRDPLKHIMWVKFAISWASLGVVIQLYLVAQGVVDFSQAGPGIIQDFVFAAAFLAFYPYRATRSG